MNYKIITLTELSKIIGLNKDTLRTWLQGYRFAPYEMFIGAKRVYTLNDNFIEVFCDFLQIKHKFEMSKKIENFYKKNSCQ